MLSISLIFQTLKLMVSPQLPPWRGAPAGPRRAQRARPLLLPVLPALPRAALPPCRPGNGERRMSWARRARPPRAPALLRGEPGAPAPQAQAGPPQAWAQPAPGPAAEEPPRSVPG